MWNLTNQNEFVIVRHSYLNGNSYNIEKTVEDTLKLSKYLNGRKPVLCLEGDIIQVQETGEVVLTHQNFVPLKQQKYKKLREEKIATSLTEALDKVSEYTHSNPDQRILLCFEPKVITSKQTLQKTINKLTEYKITDAYFDSFYGNKLNEINEINQSKGTSYKTSLHLWFNFGNLKFTIPYTDNYNIITVPKKTSFGKLTDPLIYGAVGSSDTLNRISQRDKVLGAYYRPKEGKGIKGALKMLWNSATNTAKLRKHIILANYSQ